MNEDAHPYVYIFSEGVTGRIINYGAWISMVEYIRGGIVYKVLMENDEFQVMRDE